MALALAACACSIFCHIRSAIDRGDRDILGQMEQGSAGTLQTSAVQAVPITAFRGVLIRSQLCMVLDM